MLIISKNVGLIHLVLVHFLSSNWILLFRSFNHVRTIFFISIHFNNLKLMLNDINGIYKIVIAMLASFTAEEEKGLKVKPKWIASLEIVWRALKLKYILHLKYSCFHRNTISKCSTKSTHTHTGKRTSACLHTWTHRWLKSASEINAICNCALHICQRCCKWFLKYQHRVSTFCVQTYKMFWWSRFEITLQLKVSRFDYFFFARCDGLSYLAYKLRK